MTAPKSCTHAGGVVVRERDGSHEFLIVRSLKNREHWVLPKGHIDRGETAEAAAVREVREEAGVDAELGRFLGTSEYVANGERCVIAFWRMRWLADVARSEDRDLAWLPLEATVARLSFADARELVRRAAATD